jgi:dolichol-phosphate mannosyltransferase
MGPPSFAVVVPMFNEETGAEACVREVCGVLASLPNRTALIAVNDGSSDRTPEILGRLAPEFSLLSPVTHPVNRGYGAALRTGVETAVAQGFEYVLFMDSDLTNHPADIPRFASMMEKGYDLVKATRYSGGGKVTGVPFYRVAISAAGNRLAKFLYRLPLHDSTNGFRAVRAKLVVDMKLSENRFPIIMEELYWLKFRTDSFAELPVELTNRGADQRPTAFVYRPRVFWNYLKYPLRAFFGLKPRAIG